MGDDDEWDQTSDDVTVCECDHCGEEKPCIWHGNPFVAEIYPDDENPESWWCRNCFETIAGDI